MGHIGLALSGGGFRATLYHLGVVRYLRDAGLLDQVSHITSVSGGSIMAAHLVLNWQRYTGSEQEYDEAAEELLNFVRMDVRNRVVRRFPLALAANAALQVTGQGRSRRLTRPGLLEAHYEKFLYGDRCLYELPAQPQLHMLATNINEGCLCSFTRSGILAQRRISGGGARFELVPRAMSTIAMAVTASSAFPGFFPPLQLTARDVGANESQFPPHLFTDGGVYDNLGVRMFRHIQESWIGHDTPLRPDDFVDLAAAAETLSIAKRDNDQSASALVRLGNLVSQRTGQPESAGQPVGAEQLPESLWNVIVHDRLYTESAFADLQLHDEHAAELRRMAGRGRKLSPGDHLWLNRYLINESFDQAGKGTLLNSVQAKFNAVIVSDAGKQFNVARRTKSSGLLGTAIRASDILMDRVWELEKDHFQAESDFLFAPMTLTVHPAEDPTALHPEIQNQVANTRTDLDQFSELEISGLVRHGYAVVRKVCRARPDLFGDDSPAGPPWDPTPEAPVTIDSERAPSATTEQARLLQSSSQRQILSRFLDFRDWPTYVFIPLLLVALVGVPYYAYQGYLAAHRSSLIVDAITFSNPDFQLVLELAQKKPIPGDWEPLIPEEVDELPPTNLGGFRLITDTRILDARTWKKDASDNQIVIFRRMLVRRVAEAANATPKSPGEMNRFRIHQFSPADALTVRSNNEGGLKPVLRKAPGTGPNGEPGFLYEADFDLSSVPSGADFDIGFELVTSGIQGRKDRVARLTFPIIAPTDVATMWVLLPPGGPYHDVTLLVTTKMAPPWSTRLSQPTVLTWQMVRFSGGCLSRLATTLFTSVDGLIARDKRAVFELHQLRRSQLLVKIKRSHIQGRCIAETATKDFGIDCLQRHKVLRSRSRGPNFRLAVCGRNQEK